MEVNLVAEGFKLMVLGMSAVFLFLVLIIYALKFQHYIINKFFPQIQQLKNIENSQSVIDPNLVAVITAAIKQFQTSRKGK